MGNKSASIYFDDKILKQNRAYWPEFEARVVTAKERAAAEARGRKLARRIDGADKPKTKQCDRCKKFKPLDRFRYGHLVCKRCERKG